MRILPHTTSGHFDSQKWIAIRAIMNSAQGISVDLRICLLMSMVLFMHSSHRWILGVSFTSALLSLYASGRMSSHPGVEFGCSYVTGSLVLPLLGYTVVEYFWPTQYETKVYILLQEATSVVLMLLLYSPQRTFRSKCLISSLPLSFLLLQFGVSNLVANIFAVSGILVLISLLRLVPIQLSVFESGVITGSFVFLCLECWCKLGANTMHDSSNSNFSDSIIVTEIGVLCVALTGCSLDTNISA